MKNSNIIFFFLTLVLISCNQSEKADQSNFQPLAASTEFDVVILNGRVMDPETNFDEVWNVGIKNCWNALIIEEKISGFIIY